MRTGATSNDHDDLSGFLLTTKMPQALDLRVDDTLQLVPKAIHNPAWSTKVLLRRGAALV